MTVDQQMRYRSLVDRVGNLQLLSKQENLEKSSTPFDEWLVARHETSKHRHLIPDDSSFYSFDRFEEFISAREELIRLRLKSLFVSPLDQDAQELA